jgi:hypothetical protein
MAFTSQGMFYLDKEDLAPTIGMVGTGVRGMLGMQNEEEAVKSLMASSDLESTEGRQSFLNQLQGISPDAHKEFSKQFREANLGDTKLRVAEKTLDIKDLEFNRKVNEPLVKQRWELEGKDNFARTYVIEKLRNVMSEEDLKAFLPTVKASNVKLKLGMMINKLKNDGVLSEDNAKLFKPTDFKGLLKSARANYINQWQDKDVSADLFKETVDTSSDTDTTNKNIVISGEGGVKTESKDTASFGKGYLPISPEQSQIVQAGRKLLNKTTLRDRLARVYHSLVTLTPDFALNDAELKREDLKDEVQEWIGFLEVNKFFQENPGELEAFEKDPIGYYVKSIKGESK